MSRNFSVSSARRGPRRFAMVDLNELEWVASELPDWVAGAYRHAAR